MTKEVEILRNAIKGQATHAKSQIDILEDMEMGRVGQVFKYIAVQLEDAIKEADKVRDESDEYENRLLFVGCQCSMCRV